MIRNDKLTLKYKETIEHEVDFWPPHSRYILLKNIIINGIVLMIMLLCVYGLYVLDGFNDTTMWLWSLQFIAILLVVGSTYHDWKRGVNYDYAKKMLKLHTTEEQREEYINQTQKYEQYKKKVFEEVRTLLVEYKVPNQSTILDKILEIK